MEKIQYVGASLLTPVERQKLETLTAEYYPKIQREVHGDLSLKIHIKEKGSEKERKQYTIHAMAVFPKKQFNAQASDWDFARTVHKVFEEIKHQLD